MQTVESVKHIIHRTSESDFFLSMDFNKILWLFVENKVRKTVIRNKKLELNF